MVNKEFYNQLSDDLQADPVVEAHIDDVGEENYDKAMEQLGK